MLTRKRWLDIAGAAWDALDSFNTQRNGNLPPRRLVKGAIPIKRNWATSFASAAAKARVLSQSSLPRPNYGSWLIVYWPADSSGASPHFGIALSREQFRKWAASGGVPEEVQQARAILHEVGHALEAPGRFQMSPDPTAPPADAGDEELAWAYSMALYALSVGDYAVMARPLDMDDTPSLML